MIYPDAPGLCNVCKVELEVPETVVGIVIRDPTEPPRCAECGRRVSSNGERILNAGEPPSRS